MSCLGVHPAREENFMYYEITLTITSLTDTILILNHFLVLKQSSECSILSIYLYKFHHFGMQQTAVT